MHLGREIDSASEDYNLSSQSSTWINWPPATPNNNIVQYTQCACNMNVRFTKQWDTCIQPHANYMCVHAGCMHTTCRLHACTYTLHAGCIHTTCTLQAGCMHTTCTLHAGCMHTTCTLHASCMHTTTRLYVHSVKSQRIVNLGLQHM